MKKSLLELAITYKKMIHCLEIIETKQYIYIYIYDQIIEKYKKKMGYI